MKSKMKFKTPTSILIVAAAFLVLGLATASAVPITVTSGSGGNGDTDNVLFNGDLQQSGSFVQGSFNKNDNIVRFTSSSGSGLIAGSGGQAVLTGGAGNDPFSQVTFGLEGGATFTRAIFNIDATADGNVQILVNFILDGSFFSTTVTVGQSGSNFFSVDAGMGALITSISLTGQGPVTFSDIKQFRLGDFAPAQTVPEGGATLMLLGAGCMGVALLRGKLQK